MHKFGVETKDKLDRAGNKPFLKFVRSYPNSKTSTLSDPDGSKSGDNSNGTVVVLPTIAETLLAPEIIKGVGFA